MESGFAEGYAVGKDSSNGGGFGFGGYGAEWIWIIVLFALWQNGGWGNGGNGVGSNYVLATDFATIERKLDGVNNGLCDGFYAMNTGMLNGFAGVQNTLCQGFAGINQNINNVGYSIKDCCCTTQRAIDGVNYNLATQSNMLGRSIENGFAQTNYNLATQNCATLQAIDKVGDRVIDYLTQGELRKYRDSALVAQIKNEVNPCAIPSYPVPNPNCCYNANVTFSNPYNNSCGCC